MKTKLRAFLIGLISIVLSIGGLIAYASQDATFSWTAPTEYTDNTPIEEGGLTEYRLYCNGSLVATIPSTSLTHAENFAPGIYECHITALAHGIESDPSNTVTIIVEWPKPKPPVLSLN